VEQELPPLPNDKFSSTNERERRINQTEDDDQEDDWAGIQEEDTAAADSSYWEDSHLTILTQMVQDDETTQQHKSSSNQGNEGEPMILVDMTILSNSVIHNKFDKMSVNDSKAASDLRRKIESKYDTYASDALLLADRAVIPCGTTVWRDALVCLRNETPGHYFSPICPSNSNRKNSAA